MRLKRFDLTRYGLFTDFSISFGDQPVSKPDFHILYGANEAGKSTLRSAFLDLLFGIERQSIYDFKHPYPTMRVGGALEINGSARELIRVKKEKNSLLGTDDQPVSDTVLSAALGSVTRDGYETMFSLDDDTLQQGGDSILQSKGDLGQLLFSAASGLSDLGGRLDAVRAEAHAFYRAGTRRHELADAKKRLQELKDEKSKTDLQASQYTALIKAEADARTHHEAAKAARDVSRARRQHLSRVLAARSARSALAVLQAKLAPMAAIQDLPEGWLAEAQALSTQSAAAESEARLAKQAVERLTEERDALEVDDTILGLKQDIERLSDLGLEARFRTAEADIPSRKQEHDSVVMELAEIIQRLGRSSSEDPASLLLPTATEATLNGLVGRKAALYETDATAREEQDKAKARLARAAKQVKDFGDPADVAGLAALVKRVRAAGYDKEMARIERQVATLRAESDAALKRLAPWSGNNDTLAALVPPRASQISQWQETLSGLEIELRDRQRSLDDRADERDRLIADIRSIEATTGVPDDTTASDARARRTASWQAHRAGIQDDGPLDIDALRSTADAFEKSMDEDDRVTEARQRQSTDVATLREANAALIRVNAEIEKLGAKIAAPRRLMESEAAVVASAIAELGLTRDTPPTALAGWLDRRDQALAKHAEVRDALTDLDAAHGGRSSAAARLVAAMTAAGLAVDEDASIDENLDRAEAEIERGNRLQSDIRSALTTLEQAQSDVEDRDRAAKRIAEDRRSWEAEWCAALQGCWLGERRSAEDVAEILGVLRALPGEIEKRDDLNRRIEQMVADSEGYVAAVAALADKAGIPFESAPPLSVADGLRARLDDAARKDNLRDIKQKEGDQASAEQRGAAEKLRIIKARFDEMATRYPSDGFTDLLENLRMAGEKADYQAQIDRRERELLEALECTSLDDAEAFLDKETSDNDALKAEAAQLDSELADHDEMISEHFHAHQTARKALESVSGDDDVARIEEIRRTELLDIKEHADRYLALSIGALAADNALRAFRDRHRSTMMKRAGAAFATITRNGFTDLTTTPGNDGELLVGLKAGSGSMVASEMSKGTRFQLYLALRIAGYGEFVQDREALPFFADDILETFDDDRSAETFQLLSEMARQGQVIYLTHHRHLCDIAKQVCGDAVTIHALPEPAVSSRPLSRKA